MITLPPNFESDIQGQNLNLYPVVMFETSPDAEGDIMVSIKDVTLGVRRFKPLLLNIPSVKESMDFENRNYKISNVTLKISNYEYEGERFSDYAGNLINVAVKIYWISQSYPSDHTIGFTNAGDEFALQVYKGFIRRYSHDDETCTLQLEDSTQKDLHRDVPVARLGDGDEILDKYKNKPIPMVYGYVDKSPCVISNFPFGEFLNGDFFILCDNLITGVSDAPIKEVTSLNEENSLTLAPDGNPLMIYKDDSYLTVKEKTLTQTGGSPLFDFNQTDQYFVEGDKSIRMVAIDDEQDSHNPVAINNLICHYYKRPLNFKLHDEEFTGGIGDTGSFTIDYIGYINNISNINDDSVGSSAELYATLSGLHFVENGSVTDEKDLVQFDLIFEPFTDIFEEQELVEFYSKTEFILTAISNDQEHKVYFFPYLDGNVFPGIDTFFTQDTPLPYSHTFDSITGDDSPISDTPSGHWAFDILANKVPISAKSLPSFPPTVPRTEDITIKLYDAFIKHHVLIDGIKNADYYLDVNGRTDPGGYI